MAVAPALSGRKPVDVKSYPRPVDRVSPEGISVPFQPRFQVCAVSPRDPGDTFPIYADAFSVQISTFAAYGPMPLKPSSQTLIAKGLLPAIAPATSPEGAKTRPLIPESLPLEGESQRPSLERRLMRRGVSTGVFCRPVIHVQDPCKGIARAVQAPCNDVSGILFPMERGGHGRCAELAGCVGVRFPPILSTPHRFGFGLRPRLTDSPSRGEVIESDAHPAVSKAFTNHSAPGLPG